MSENLLDCPAATHTKSIENYFGRLDGLLKTSTPKGFSKSVDDLIIKCSEDLIESDKWRTKEVRDRAKKLKDMEKRFGESQKDLLKDKNNDDIDYMIQ